MITQTSSTTINDQRRYRPKCISDIFDEAFDLYKDNFLLLLCATAIFYIPLHAVSVYVLAPITEAQSVLDTRVINPDSLFELFGKSLGTALVTQFAVWTVTAVLSAPVVYIVAQRYLNRPVTIGQACLASLKRAVPIFIAVLLAAAISSLGLCLCILPGILWSCLWLCVPQVALLEPKMSPIALMRRSRKLASPNVWTIAGLLILTGLISATISLSFQGVLSLILNYVPLDSVPGLNLVSENQVLANLIGDAIGGLLVAPYYSAVVTVLYFDLRIRQEGYDMNILAEKIGLGTDAGLPALPSANAPLAPQKRSIWRRFRPGAGSQ